MNKDRVVIEEGGMRMAFVQSGAFDCENECKAYSHCKESKFLHKMCNLSEILDGYKCISATKIESSPKMYFAWNREEARHLVGGKVEYYGTAGWEAGTLEAIIPSVNAFNISCALDCSSIREIPTIKLTLTELREKYGVPDNVVIVD